MMSSRLDATARTPVLSMLGLALGWAACVAVVAVLVGRFWIPLDDGTLAQSAERVMVGQLPHRDFGDPYSGLGAVLGALSFRLFGVSLASLRIPLVVGFALWLPAVWLTARRFAAPALAIAATLLAATLSVLAYPAAMPTWYGLFLATWCVWMMLRFLDGGGRRWLVGVGGLVGISVLFKVVGLYTLAAALLTCAWRRADGSPAHRGLVVAGCVLFLAALGRMVLPGTGLAGIYHFFLPAVALCASLTARSWRADCGFSGGARALLVDVAALGAGVAVPVAIFLIPYAASGSVGAWFAGVFLLPARRLSAAASPPGGVLTVVPGIAAVSLAAAGSRLAADSGRHAAMGLATVLAMALALDDASGGAVFSALWYSARAWIPALAVVGACIVRNDDRWSVLAAAALWTLVQFPYTAPAYFFYVAPLGVLATLAVLVTPPDAAPVRRAPTRRRSRTVGVTAPLVLIAGIYAFLGTGYATGVLRSSQTPLTLERGGIRVSAQDAALYGELIATVRAHVGDGAVWAGPDAPEVYFLAGAPNPTPILYEFLAPDAERREDPRRLVDEGVRVVVVNTRPLFSAPLDESRLSALERAFPESRKVGAYVVRWRVP